MSSLRRMTAMVERFSRAVRMMRALATPRTRSLMSEAADAVLGQRANDKGSASAAIFSTALVDKLFLLGSALSRGGPAAYLGEAIRNARGPNARFKAAMNAAGAAPRRIHGVDYGAGRSAALAKSARRHASMADRTLESAPSGAIGHVSASDGFIRGPISSSGLSAAGAQTLARARGRGKVFSEINEAPAIASLAARRFSIACDLFARAVRGFSALASGEPMRSPQSAALGASRLASDPSLSIYKPGPRATRAVRSANSAAGASLLLRQPAALRAGDGGGALGGLARRISAGLANARLVAKKAGLGAHARERAVALAQSAWTRAAVLAATSGALDAPSLRRAAVGAVVIPQVPGFAGAGVFARNAQSAPTIIHYAPELVIHAEAPADHAHLRQRVLGILERHARELYEALAREKVRRQRMQFAPLAGAGL